VVTRGSEGGVVIRSSYIPAPHYFDLDMACASVVAAFGPHVYLVGSSIERRDFRDVDVRCILPDEDFDRMFPLGGSSRDPLWSLTCSSVSLWLSKQSGLPVDFQIQRRTQANAEEPGAGRRRSLGLFYGK
jgi:hypothetical protein